MELEAHFGLLAVHISSMIKMLTTMYITEKLEPESEFEKSQEK